jgi:LemA protein
MTGLVLGGAAFIAIWVAAMYNGLVRLRNHCTESWADIDTELKRRHELIPSLVATVKGYALYERDLFERIAAARTAALAAHDSPAAQAHDEQALDRNVRQLLAVAENYPELRANQHYLELQRELANTEDRLQRARRFYNANVRDFNTRMEVFPSSLIAGGFGFTRREYFEWQDETARA